MSDNATGNAARARRVKLEVLATAIALLFALLVGALLVLLYQRSPAQVYGLMLVETWGSLDGIGQVLFRAGPLAFTGLAVAVAFRAGLFNIGAEGQAVAGAFAAALVGTQVPDVAVLAPLLCLLAAMIVGASAGALPGLLKARYGAHEVITTMMLNLILIGAVKQLGFDHFFDYPHEHTLPVVGAGRLGHSESAGVATLLAALAAGGTWWFLMRTRTGFGLTALGAAPDAAAAAGIRPGRTVVIAMAVSGALAGLVAAGLVLGNKGYFQADLVTGYGFMGIAVALLGRAHPLGVLAAALFLATLSRGGVAVASLVPKEIVDVLQAVIILAVAAVAPLARARLAEQRSAEAS